LFQENNQLFKKFQKKNFIEDESTHKSGFLSKEGDRFKTWRRRWFRIHDHYLSYYNNVGETKPIKSINLKNASAQTAPLKCNSSRPYVFQLKTPRRTYYFNASSDEERTDWMNCLKKLAEKVSSDPNIQEGDIGSDDEYKKFFFTHKFKKKKKIFPY